MTNSKLLQKKIDESGLKKGFIAENLGISTAWLKKKVNGKAHFKAYEIQILCDLLGIVDLEEKDEIFFA